MDYFPRKIEKKLEKWISREEIILIKGPRQSGKTTFLKHLEEKYGGEYISLEIEEYAEAIKKDPISFAKRFISRKFLYIDEAQYVKEIGKYLKIIQDNFKGKLKLVVTGSGSFEVKENLGKYLVGRAVYFELLPLTFEEFLLWKREDLHSLYKEYNFLFWKFLKGEEVSLKSPIFEKEFIELLEEFIIFGGFPAIVKENDVQIKIELLKNLIQTYLEKDIFFFLNVRQLNKFKNFLKSLALNIGNIIEISSFSREFKMDFRTVEEYLNILIYTYIIEPLLPFHKSLITELKKSKKLYFIDTGLRNALINNFLPFSERPDRGFLLENFVLSELRKNELETKYWRTAGKAEIDFIVFLENKTIPLEVKITPKIEKSLYSFIRTYKPERAMIMNLNFSEVSVKKINSTELAFIPCFYL
ncbi:MAG: putative ATPase [Thermodesulfobacterium sp.]|uniref:ATPase n=1 Tax=Candidatus Thermodesulfobacterium syntrophicum TaxID=3060442 RepID=A0AAE3TG00_9BACT|nr:putative ATPase [Candidatus Thermodesulfobacterium syntrophicum]